MSESISGRGLTRRAFLTGTGAATAYALAGAPGLGRSAPRSSSVVGRPVANVTPNVHLAGTDGWVSMPDGSRQIPPFWPDPWAPQNANIYAFGFRDVTGFSAADLVAQRGKAQISAPVLGFDEYDGTTKNDVRIKLSNLGLSMRPDLVDGHTIHWHGFVNAIPLFDGVPELSISVPIGRDFTYYYRPHDPGTYMYHCHFEDVEHVQMGMTGVVYVRPRQNGTWLTALPSYPAPQPRYVFNDGDGTTRYDREFSYMINEIWAEAHYRDAHIQTTDWTDYSPSFWTLNGRSYPDTVAPGGWDPFAPAAGTPERLRYQPISSLVTCNAGERVLLRMANLGYQNHRLTCDAIPFDIVGKDSVRLSNGDVNHYLHAPAVEIGPGESRDAIFTAPDVTAKTSYLLYDRSYGDLNNDGGPGLGGQMTRIDVYPPGHLTPQPINSPNA